MLGCKSSDFKVEWKTQAWRHGECWEHLQRLSKLCCDFLMCSGTYSKCWCSLLTPNAQQQRKHVFAFLRKTRGSVESHCFQFSAPSQDGVEITCKHTVCFVTSPMLKIRWTLLNLCPTAMCKCNIHILYQLIGNIGLFILWNASLYLHQYFGTIGKSTLTFRDLLLFNLFLMRNIKHDLRTEGQKWYLWRKTDRWPLWTIKNTFILYILYKINWNAELW